MPIFTKVSRMVALGTLDDHESVPEPYCVTIRVNGTVAAENVDLVLLHGDPYGGPFENFQVFAVDLDPSTIIDGENVVEWSLGCTGSTDWAVFEWTALEVHCNSGS